MQNNVIQAHGHASTGRQYFTIVWGRQKPMVNFQNVQMLFLTNLVNWTFVNNVLPESSGDLARIALLNSSCDIHVQPHYVIVHHIDNTNYSSAKQAYGPAARSGNYTYRAVPAMGHDRDDNLFRHGRHWIFP